MKQNLATGCLIGSLALALVVLWSLLFGPVETPFNALFDPQHNLHSIIWQIRWPRALNAILVGGCLSLAGLLIQNMVKNQQ